MNSSLEKNRLKFGKALVRVGVDLFTTWSSLGKVSHLLWGIEHRKKNMITYNISWFPVNLPKYFVTPTKLTFQSFTYNIYFVYLAFYLCTVVQNVKIGPSYPVLPYCFYIIMLHLDRLHCFWMLRVIKHYLYSLCLNWLMTELVEKQKDYTCLCINIKVCNNCLMNLTICLNLKFYGVDGYQLKLEVWDITQTSCLSKGHRTIKTSISLYLIL